jgi:hypothetical protein
MLPSSDESHNQGSAFFWDQEEDKDKDGGGLRERDDYKGKMTTTNDCSGHGRRIAEGRWNRNIVAIKRRR